MTIKTSNSYWAAPSSPAQLAKGELGNATGTVSSDGRLTAAHYDIRPAFLSRPNSASTSNANNPQTNTYSLVTSSPVPYYAVRVTYQHLGGNGSVAGFKMALAASDDIGSRDFTDPSAANFRKCQVPKKAGVTYNALAPDGSPGWKAVTWGGAETLDIADPGGTLQKETLTFTGTATGTSITVAGTAVTIVNGDSAATVAGKVATALAAVTATYTSAVANGAVVTILYKVPGRFSAISGATQAGITWVDAVILFGEIKIASVSSDIIAETGLLDVNNGIYPLLFRWLYGSASWSYIPAYASMQVGTNLKDDFPSYIFIGMNRSGDGVTTPSTWQESGTPSITNSAVSIQIEFFTDQGVMSVAMVGDSRFQISSEFNASNPYRSSEMYLHNALIALGEKPSIIRHGISGGQSWNYQPRALPDYVIETPPRWMIYIVYSANDGAPSDGVMSQAKTRAIQAIEQARKKGTRVILIPTFPSGFGAPAWNSSQLALVKDLNNFCTGLGDVFFDAMGIYGNADGSWGPFGFDINHMTDAGYRDLASRLATILHTK